MSTILDDGKAARDIAARQPEADNDYETEVHAAACWLDAEGQGDALYLTHYADGTTLWRTAGGGMMVRCKVDWLHAREAARNVLMSAALGRRSVYLPVVDAQRRRWKPTPLPPDPELISAIRDRLFGEEGES